MPASAWAVAKAEAVCADSVWTDELVERMAVALDEAEARGALEERRRKWNAAIDLQEALSDRTAAASRLRQRIRERVVWANELYHDTMRRCGQARSFNDYDSGDLLEAEAKGVNKVEAMLRELEEEG